MRLAARDKSRATRQRREPKLRQRRLWSHPAAQIPTCLGSGKDSSL